MAAPPAATLQARAARAGEEELALMGGGADDAE
jgi:hypothetical protein